MFQGPDFLQLSESMVHMMMARNLEVAEIVKFEAMLTWAKNRVKTKGGSKADSRVEFRCIMERLTRELKPYRISPQDLIKVRGRQNSPVALRSTCLQGSDGGRRQREG